MACTFVSFTHADSTTATISTGSITVAAGQSLAVCVHWKPNGVETVTSVVWNTSESLTQVGTGRLYYLKNPTAGTHVVTATLNSDPAGRIGLAVWVVAGLDQTTSVRTPTTGTTDPGSSVGDLVIGGMTANFGDTNTFAANASATEDSNVNTNPGTGGTTSFWMVAEHEAGAAGTTPMAFQHPVSDGNATIRADFVALIAAAGGSAVSGAGYYLRRRHAA